LEDRAEKVTELQTKLSAAQSQSSDSMIDQGPAREVTRKVCRDSLWNAKDIVDYLSGLTDARHVLDLSTYLDLLKEGNDSIRKKEMPLLSVDKTKEGRKKCRRFDRDFYRTCVGEGLRNICYRFLLPPNRVGIKMEDMSSSNLFDFNKVMPGEQNPSPQNWVATMIESQSPDSFANELIGSGELILLSSTGGVDPDDQEASDPLRGCRYVAAMELAHEPRVRRHLRNVYRRHAVFTTRPTKRGMEMIDAFHNYYGLHLIKNKGIKEHFPMDEKDSAEKKAELGPEECRELDREMKKREHDSCLQYLNILNAERTGHISVHVHLPLLDHFDDWYNQDQQYTSRDKQDLKPLMDELERVYFPLDGDTDEWNSERRKVLTQALLSFLLPKFEAETRRELREAAVKVGVESAGENLYNLAMEGPYRPQSLMHTENRFLYPTGDLPMVGICCSSDPKEATYLASVTERGTCNDHLAIPGGTRIDSGKYREKVIMFLLQSRPAAVLVGTSGGFESRVLHRKMNEIISEALQRWKDKDIQGDDEDDEDFEARRASFDKLIPSGYDDDDEEEWKCNADMIDDTVSQLFGRSVRGKKEFPDHHTNLKIAISTARYAKDPLGELTYAWSVASDTGNFGAELLYINIHPMQQLLPRTLLLRQYERALCEVVADVGVDINAACSLDHLQGLLTFVSGFGPRKANSLKQSIEKLGEVIGSRRFLLEKRLMGPIVYSNAVAFLRIRNVDVDDGQIMNPLDDTRLHPDVYNRNSWAAKIATDALERAEDETRNKERAAIKALRDVMDNSGQEVERLFLATKEEWEVNYGPTFNVFEWNPRVNVPSDKWRDKVEELDLDAFAEMIKQSGLGKWHSHLQMIKWEFRLPFADPRTPMEPLTGDKLFKLITGETDQSLRPGKEVTGKVVRNGDFGSRVKLEGEIPAFIPLRNLADEHVETAEDVVTVGMVVTAVVTEVKKDHMCVDMSLKMEDFRKQPSKWDRPSSLPPLDDHFDYHSSALIEEKKSKEREARLEAQQLSLGHTRLGDHGAPKNRMGRVTRRACAHPAFRNARNDEVERELKEGGPAMVGEALVRPSSKSSDSLAVHWMVQEGSVKVVEVVEEDKDTDASIGNILKIKVSLK
jgi:transcription elongation factor SPT6